MMYRSLLRPLLFQFDSEQVHCATIAFTRFLSALHGEHLVAPFFSVRDSRLSQRLFGLEFPNPIGLAAGFDKDAVGIPLLGSLGFGCLEIGSVTAEPQPGNPKPRIFRLVQDEALINRMGFPSEGALRVRKNLGRIVSRQRDFILGINIGKSKSAPLERALEDYLFSFSHLEPYGDYFAVNVSSPNTPGLRELQEKEKLRELLSGLQEANTNQKPLLLKIAPDLELSALDDVVEVARECQISAIIATNTTFSRDNLREDPNEVGGLSGEPLRARSLEVVGHLARQLQHEIPLIAVGGISHSLHVLQYFASGASLVQLYTGLVMSGPSVVRDICRVLLGAFDRFHISSVSELRGNRELCDQISGFIIASQHR